MPLTQEQLVARRSKIGSSDAAAILWQNDVAGPDRNWLEIFLDTSAVVGLAPDGVGARPIAETGAGSQYLYITRGATHLGQSPLVAGVPMGLPVQLEGLEGAVVVATREPRGALQTLGATILLAGAACRMRHAAFPRADLEAGSATDRAIAHGRHSGWR